jgi:hypothetical protein
MEEKSDIEILQEIAKATHRPIEVAEIPHPHSGIGTTQKFRRTAFMPFNEIRSSFFVWFYDPYTQSVGQTVVFSGAFIPLTSRVKSKLDIRNSFFLDKLSLSSKARRNKIGNSHFDQKVTLTGEIDTAARRVLSRTDVQKQILKALAIEQSFHVSINHSNVDFVPELQNKSTMSIIDPRGWVTNKNHIESMFSIIEKIADIIHLK